jgi:hypothetical protein
MWLTERVAGCCFQRLAVLDCPAVTPGERGSTGPQVSFLVAGMVLSGQPEGRACRWVIAAVSWVAQGQVAAKRSRRPRHLGPGARRRRTGAAAAVSVPQVRAGPSRASICIQAVSSQAIATSSHQIWFWLCVCTRPPSTLRPRITGTERAGSAERITDHGRRPTRMAYSRRRTRLASADDLYWDPNLAPLPPRGYPSRIDPTLFHDLETSAGYSDKESPSGKASSRSWWYR